MHALNSHVLQHCHYTEELFMRLLLPTGVRGRSVAWPAAAPRPAAAAERWCWCFCLAKGWGFPKPPLGCRGKVSCSRACCVLNLCVPLGTFGTPFPLLRGRQKRRLLLQHRACYQGKLLHHISGLCLSLCLSRIDETIINKE